MNAPRLSSLIRIALLGAAAVGFASLAVVAADRHITREITQHQELSRKPEPANVPVVVAKFDLVAGERVGPETMAVRSVPADLLPGSVIRPEHFDSHVGARLARPMRGGEPLLAEILQTPDPGGLSQRMRQGIRALTLAVDEVSSVSGLLRPGDRIDLLLTARPPATGAAPSSDVTRVLVQDVAVLATGRQVGAGSEEGASRPFTSITMELGPEDAKRVVAAQRAGRITAMLRHPDDRHPVSPAAVDMFALLGLPREQAAPPRADPAMLPAGPEIITGGMGAIANAREKGGDASIRWPAPGTSLSAQGALQPPPPPTAPTAPTAPTTPGVSAPPAVAPAAHVAPAAPMAAPARTPQPSLFR